MPSDVHLLRALRRQNSPDLITIPPDRVSAPQIPKTIDDLCGFLPVFTQIHNLVNQLLYLG
jgi:hypothetical protein